MQNLYPYSSILNAPSIGELFDAVGREAGNHGFSAFHYGAHTPRKPDGTMARFLFDGTEQKSVHVLSAYPESWFTRYNAENYIEVDPVVQHCSRSVLPYVWHQQAVPDNARARQMFCEARQHGLADGVTFSVFGAHQEIGLLSLTMDRCREQDKRNVVAGQGGGYMLVVHIHEAMRRLQFAVASAPNSVSLTQRESECLTWVSAGKTSWEIGHIMDISERTVNFHIGNATSKLDCATRRHAAVKALTLGLIRP